MKTILCFGDSNTWGWIPGPDGGRFPHDVRWPGVMAAQLGDRFYVVEEALNGRTTVWDDPFEPVHEKNGRRHLPVALESHKPIDLVILMLGTNDLKHHLCNNADDIAFGAGVLCDMILASDAGPGEGAPQLLLVSPAPVAEGECPFAHLFEEAPAVSARFAETYAAAAEDRGIPFLNGGEFAQSSPLDCIHIDDQSHRRLGEAMAEKVAGIL